MSELILVRHGQASFGADSYDKLSATGLRQMEILAQHWQQLGERFDALYSGELRRQLETADALLPLIDGNPATTTVHPGLNEYNGSPLIEIYLRDHAADEGMAGLRESLHERKAFQQVFEAATARWIADELKAREDDVDFEPWGVFKQRVHSTISALMNESGSGRKILLATSGGVISLAVQYVLGLSDEQAIAMNWTVNNSSVTRIRYGAGRVSLSLFNGLSHLERPGYRELITFR